MFDPFLFHRFMTLVHAMMAAGICGWYLGVLPRGFPERRFLPMGLYMALTAIIAGMRWAAMSDLSIAEILPDFSITAAVVSLILLGWAHHANHRPGEDPRSWLWRMKAAIWSHFAITFAAPVGVHQGWLNLPPPTQDVGGFILLLALVLPNLKFLRKRGHSLHASMIFALMGCSVLGWLVVGNISSRGRFATDQDLLNRAATFAELVDTRSVFDSDDSIPSRLRLEAALNLLRHQSSLVTSAFVTPIGVSRGVPLASTPPVPDRLAGLLPSIADLHLISPRIERLFDSASGESSFVYLAPVFDPQTQKLAGIVGLIVPENQLLSSGNTVLVAAELIIVFVVFVFYSCVAGYLQSLVRLKQRDALLEINARVSQELLHRKSIDKTIIWLVEALREKFQLIHVSFWRYQGDAAPSAYTALTSFPAQKSTSSWPRNSDLNSAWSTALRQGETLEGKLSQLGFPPGDLNDDLPGEPWVIATPVCSEDTPWGILILVFPARLRTNRQEIPATLQSIANAFAFSVARQERNAHLAAAEERLRTIIEASPDGFWDHDYTSGQRLISERWWRMLDRDPPQINETTPPYQALIDPTDFAKLQQEITSIHPAGRRFRRREFRAKHADGSWRWIESNTIEIRHQKGPLSRAIGFDRDVTERRRSEDRLRSAADSAAQANRAKSDFLASMSHELRTPLNSVIGFSSILDRSPLNTDQREWISSLRNAAEQLLGLISGVLDFSQIEAGKLSLDLEPFELLRNSEQAMEHLSRVATDKGIALHLEFLSARFPAWVLGDALRFRQIITNLVGNAVKFTASGFVHLRVQNPEPEKWVFEIADSGPGMSEDQVATLFQRFNQLDSSSTRPHGGTGLGLAISQELARAMHGDIQVKSEIGQGSTFTATLTFPVTAGASRRVADRPVPLHRCIPVFDGDLHDHAVLASALVNAACPLLPFTTMAELFTHLETCREPTYVVFPLAFRVASVTAARQIRDRLSGLKAPVQLIALQAAVLGDRVASPFDVELSAPLRRREFVTIISGLRAASAPPFAFDQTTAEKEKANLVNLRVLVAEDHALNRQVIGIMLNELGIGADYAENGRVAIDRLGQRAYDVALIDIQMPEVDGFGVADFVQTQWHGNWPKPFMVAVTANAAQGDRERCLDAGMDDYLPKPITFAHLSQLLHRFHPEVPASDAPPKSAESVDISPPASEPGDDLIDWPNFQKMVEITNAEEEPEVLGEIISTYAHDSDEMLTTAASCHELDWPKAKAELHKLKGATGSLSFQGCLTSLRAVHDPAEAPPPAERTRLIAELKARTSLSLVAIYRRYPNLNVDLT